MIAAVCELPSHPDLSILRARIERLRPDLLLLNEMPWGAWVAASPDYDDARFAALCTEADRGIAALPELNVPVVLGSRPRRDGARRLNEAFVWTARGGYQAVHAKQYFPEEPGFHESRWFERGDPHFRIHDVDGLRVGFLICTEVMFNEHARAYGRAGAHVIAVPGATEKATTARWRVAMQMAAMASGCWVLSSNRTGFDTSVEFGGAGQVVDPRGTVVAETSAACPVVACDVDPVQAEAQKSNYPSYVAELPSPVSTR